MTSRKVRTSAGIVDRGRLGTPASIKPLANGKVSTPAKINAAKPTSSTPAKITPITNPKSKAVSTKLTPITSPKSGTPASIRPVGGTTSSTPAKITGRVPGGRSRYSKIAARRLKGRGK